MRLQALIVTILPLLTVAGPIQSDENPMLDGKKLGCSRPRGNGGSDRPTPDEDKTVQCCRAGWNGNSIVETPNQMAWPAVLCHRVVDGNAFAFCCGTNLWVKFEW
jgi:hypothetical protein